MLCVYAILCLTRRYTVTVHTSDIRGAGTDANVSCIIMGDKANTPMCKLDNSKNNFERGQVGPHWPD